VSNTVVCAWCSHPVPQTPSGVHRKHAPDGSLVFRNPGTFPCDGSGIVNPPEGEPSPVAWVTVESCGCVRSIAYLWAYPSRRQAAREMGAKDGRVLLVCTDAEGHNAATTALEAAHRDEPHYHPEFARLAHPLDGAE
jgi:hypothetical protein